MEQILYEMESYGMEMSSFQLEGLESSLLDDDNFLSLRKVQGDVYNQDDVGQDALHHLFPDLLPLEQESDPLSMDWMETMDLSHFIEKPPPEPIQSEVPISVQPEDIDLLRSLLQDKDLTQSELHESFAQLTPPDSPPAQVAPEIDLFDHQAAWEIIQSPLSPQEIERVLTPESFITDSLTPELYTPESQTPESYTPESPYTSDSSCPSSPASVQFSTIDTSYLQDDPVRKTKAKPYERTSRAKRSIKYSVKVEDDVDLDFSFRADEKLSKRERKKLQNKNAATKYRLKKKQESALIVSEEDQLEAKNKELQDKVDQLSREISCMKDVLGDIYKGLEAKTKKH